ncbi:hypothetical protein [Methylocystis sp. H62]|uniref:hypothetical protein n=1 Tax=Methylocystis sp. H62 TaxID=2785789 RepID=UPI003916FDA8
MFAPYGDRRAEQGAVNFLVVAPGDLPTQRALEFAERHRREVFRFVALAGCWIGESRARIKMHAPHHRANQALNVPAIMRSADGPQDELNAFFAARPCKSMAAEISAIVCMHGLGQPRGRPRRVDLALLQPCALVVNRVQHAEAERDARRLVHRQMKTNDHAREHVDGERQPGSPFHCFPCRYIDQENIDLCVINLHDFKRSRCHILTRHGLCGFDGL